MSRWTSLISTWIPLLTSSFLTYLVGSTLVTVERDASPSGQVAGLVCVAIALALAQNVQEADLFHRASFEVLTLEAPATVCRNITAGCFTNARHSALHVDGTAVRLGAHLE